MWNNSIDSINVSFLPTCLTLYSSVKTLQIKGTAQEYLTSTLLGIYAVGIIGLLLTVLIKNRKRLAWKSSAEVFGNLYSKIQIEGRVSLVAFLYWPISMIRRLVFCSIPFMFHDSGRQIQFLIFGESLYIIWYA